nr:uncharacterized protein LOC127323383 isoform X4 [Lolium perenne]
MVMGYRMTWMFVEDPRRRVGAQGVRRRKCKTEIHAREAKQDTQQPIRQWQERPHENPQAGAHQQQQPAAQKQMTCRELNILY